MPTITQTWRSVLPHSPAEVWDWHARPGAFERLMPPWQDLTLREQATSLGVGARTVFHIHMGPATVTWVAEHTACDPGVSFVDEQRKGPFAAWRHTHRFVPEDGGCALDDEVVWTPPGGPLGAIGVPALRQTNDRMFRFRHRRTAEDLDRHAAYRDQPRKTVAITGASGLVGSALAAFLTTGGHRVVRVGRSASGPGSCRWDPAKGEIDLDALQGVDAVVHLAGSSIATRWTPEHKRSILDSRVEGTRLIVDAIERLDVRPEVLISASAIGIYGHRGDDVMDEDSALGEGFLCDVGRAWEAEARRVDDLGVRLVQPRIGIVTTASGAALKAMLPIFQAGGGGPIGSGQQWVSWISLDDLVYALHAAIFETSWSGVFNAVAPHPVQQVQQARDLGAVLGRPSLLPAPSFALKALLGEMSEVVLDSTRVRPARLEAWGHRFTHPEHVDALHHTLGR